MGPCRTALDKADSRAKLSEGSEYRSPLLDAVKERGDRAEEITLHVPGHKVLDDTSIRSE